ncbi:MAG: 30S ribosomal protein S20 [Planctomycetaceae bacterium]
MPNNRNAAKAARQNEKRRLRNRTARSSLKTLIKRVREAVAKNDGAAADSALQSAVKRLDQAASKKLIHRNKAARLKSRLSALAATPKAAAKG